MKTTNDILVQVIHGCETETNIESVK